METGTLAPPRKVWVKLPTSPEVKFMETLGGVLCYCRSILPTSPEVKFMETFQNRFLPPLSRQLPTSPEVKFMETIGWVD